MSYIGLLGQLPFVCSRKKVLTFGNLNRTLGARWAKHDLIGRKPLLEFVGPELATVTLDIRFDRSLNLPPEIGLLRLKKMLENKQYKTLVIGDEYLGRYVIDSISEERKFYDGLGFCIIATASINLTEWAG